MKRLLACGRCIVLLLALLATTTQAAAQGAIGVKLDGVDASQFPKITAQVTVVDENGLPVLGLTPDRFELLEDGQASFAPAEARAVMNEKAAVSVLILLDLSSTMKGAPLQAAREASAKFLGRLLNEASDPDRAAFIGFGQQVDLKALTLTAGTTEVPFTNDKGRLLNVINFVEVDKDAGTPLYDALYRAIKIVAAQPGRRALIVMTDGRDVGSTLKDGDPIAEAQRQHIPIFPIGFSNSRLDKSYLTRLAELTGGHYQEAPTPDQVAQKFDEILPQLKVQYLLTYSSKLPKADGQTHSLLVRANTPRGQGFDEGKFQLGQPSPVATLAPTIVVPAAAAVAQPKETARPQVTPTPERKTGIMDDFTTWIGENTLIVVVLAAAVILLLLLIAFIIVFMRRRSSEQAVVGGAPPAVAGGEPYAPAAQPVWAAEPSRPALATGRDEVIARTGATGTVATANAGLPPIQTGTWVAPTDAPVAPAPFGPPPVSAGRSFAPGGEPEDVEGTVVISRGPKQKVVGLLVDRKQPTRRFDVDKPTVTIGRAAGNNIIIEHPTISRQHAAIKLEGDAFRLYDLGSANGTFIGEKRVREPLPLEDGAIVRFGAVEFVFKRMQLG